LHSLTLSAADAGPGRIGVRLEYPRAQQHEQVGDPPGDVSADLTYRPDSASAGRATFLVDGRPVTASAGGNGVFSVPATPGSKVQLEPGAVADQYGNANGQGLVLQP